MRGRYERPAADLEHDRVLLDTEHEGIRIRIIEGPGRHGHLRATVGLDQWGGIAASSPILHLRRNREQAADLLERCARALRSLA